MMSASLSSAPLRRITNDTGTSPGSSSDSLQSRLMAVVNRDQNFFFYQWLLILSPQPRCELQYHETLARRLVKMDTCSVFHSIFISLKLS
jgi:hypothetical protein